jgi:hypothetical protein
MRYGNSPAIEFKRLPPLALVGFEWTGTYRQAADGEIGRLMTALKSNLDLADDEDLFGVSWLDRPDGFRHFVGVSRPKVTITGKSLKALKLPSLMCLTVEQAAGDATDGYAQLMEERERRNYRACETASMIDQHITDSGRLRLWLPYRSTAHEDDSTS